MQHKKYHVFYFDPKLDQMCKKPIPFELKDTFLNEYNLDPFNMDLKTINEFLKKHK